MNTTKGSVIYAYSLMIWKRTRATNSEIIQGYANCWITLVEKH